jgi:DNA mismatch repair protein MutL
MARQLAVKPGTRLQQPEMQQIIADLFCCQTPTLSPSGRKTMVILQPDQLFN